MNMCLKMLFTLSLSGTALILVLLGATRIFGSHMGRRWQYYIWLAAVLRLLLPIPSPAGLIFPDALSSGMSAGLLSDGGIFMPGWMDVPAAEILRDSRNRLWECVRERGRRDWRKQEIWRRWLSRWEIPQKLIPQRPIPQRASGLYLFLLTLWLSVAALLMGRRIWNYRSAARLYKRNESLAIARDGGLEAYGAPLEEACRVCG